MNRLYLWLSYKRALVVVFILTLVLAAGVLFQARVLVVLNKKAAVLQENIKQFEKKNYPPAAPQTQSAMQDGLLLQGIFRDKNYQVCLINGQVLSAGQTIGDYVIEKVEAQGVIYRPKNSRELKVIHLRKNYGNIFVHS